ncbi:MAG: ATP-binding cassette domain-containing protein, partial [Hyphomicrobiaceae bacterium]
MTETILATDDVQPNRGGEIELSVRDVHAWYGESHILHGMSFDVPRGEVVTLLGRNGAGKTTTMRAIMGLMRQRRGAVRYKGTETIAMQPHAIARLGIAYCPEERGI